MRSLTSTISRIEFSGEKELNQSRIGDFVQTILFLSSHHQKWNKNSYYVTRIIELLGLFQDTQTTFPHKTYSPLHHFCSSQFQTQKPYYRVLTISRTFDATVPAGIKKSDDGIIISHYTPSSLHTGSINVKLELENGILTFTLTEDLFFLVNYRNFTFQILSVYYGLKKAR